MQIYGCRLWFSLHFWGVGLSLSVGGSRLPSNSRDKNGQHVKNARHKHSSSSLTSAAQQYTFPLHCTHKLIFFYADNVSRHDRNCLWKYFATVTKYMLWWHPEMLWERKKSLSTWECPCHLFQLLCIARTDRQETILQCIDCLRCQCSRVHCFSRTRASPQIHSQLNRSTAAARISTNAC